METMAESKAQATQRLTAKGIATRGRIVEAAAELIYRHGVTGTSIDDVRRAAGVSGSQMSHYFPDKRGLVRAVIARQSDAVAEFQRLPGIGRLDSFAALQTWAEMEVAEQRRCDCGGCRLGSLAGELAEPDDEVRADLAAGFGRREELLRRGLVEMRDRGDLGPEADPEELATAILGALQGGLLLTQTMGTTAPLQSSLGAMLAHVRSFATSPADREPVPL
jgi:TetR/AcrR family transcriptional regulator, transcriptional repressor for nem operon